MKTVWSLVWMLPVVLACHGGTLGLGALLQTVPSFTRMIVLGVLACAFFPWVFLVGYVILVGCLLCQQVVWWRRADGSGPELRMRQIALVSLIWHLAGLVVGIVGWRPGFLLWVTSLPTMLLLYGVCWILLCVRWWEEA